MTILGGSTTSNQADSIYVKAIVVGAALRLKKVGVDTEECSSLEVLAGTSLRQAESTLTAEEGRLALEAAITEVDLTAQSMGELFSREEGEIGGATLDIMARRDDLESVKAALDQIGMGEALGEALLGLDYGGEGMVENLDGAYFRVVETSTRLRVAKLAIGEYAWWTSMTV